MSEKIKNCKFCGGKAEIKTGQDMYDKYIECISCGCRTKTFNEYFSVRDYAIEQVRLGKADGVYEIINNATIKKAMEAWNRCICSCKDEKKGNGVEGVEKELVEQIVYDLGESSFQDLTVEQRIEVMKLAEMREQTDIMSELLSICNTGLFVRVL